MNRLWFLARLAGFHVALSAVRFWLFFVVEVFAYRRKFVFLLLLFLLVLNVFLILLVGS